MFILKGCPRCSGDLYTGIDDGLTCIQCGKDVGPKFRERLTVRVDPPPERAAGLRSFARRS